MWSDFNFNNLNVMALVTRRRKKRKMSEACFIYLIWSFEVKREWREREVMMLKSQLYFTIKMYLIFKIKIKTRKLVKSHSNSCKINKINQSHAKSKFYQWLYEFNEIINTPPLGLHLVWPRWNTRLS